MIDLILMGEIYMENNVQFISDLSEFLQRVLVMINNGMDYEILISGTFDHSLFKEILDKLLENNKINKCKILIPYVMSSGIVSRGYMNKICKSGGEIRMNSKFRKNLIVVGKEVFVLSLSSQYVKDIGIKSNFECAVQTDDSKTVNGICETFEKIWDKGLPIVNA
jgi:hypothetical protein